MKTNEYCMLTWSRYTYDSLTFIFRIETTSKGGKKTEESLRGIPLPLSCMTSVTAQMYGDREEGNVLKPGDHHVPAVTKV